MATSKLANDTDGVNKLVTWHHDTHKWILFQGKILPWLLCSVNHSSSRWSSSGYFGVKQPIVFRLAENLSSPLNRFAWSFLQRRTIDSLMPYSFAISELFPTASASATILSCEVVSWTSSFWHDCGERLWTNEIDYRYWYDGRFLSSECFVKSAQAVLLIC